MRELSHEKRKLSKRWVIHRLQKIAIQKITSAAIGALAAFGVKHVLDLDGIVTNIVENLLSPGTAIAEWLDSTDPEPNNGYWDIVLG